MQRCAQVSLYSIKVRHIHQRSCCTHQAWGTIISIRMSISSLLDFTGGLGSIRLMVGLDYLRDLLQSKWFYDSVLVQNLFVEETMVSLHKAWLLVWLTSSRFLHTTTCSDQWNRRFQCPETKISLLAMFLESAHFEIHGNIAFYVLQGQTMSLFSNCYLMLWESNTCTYEPKQSALVHLLHMHNVFHLQSPCREEEITLIFTAPLWDKYKIIPYPVVYFIHRFYLIGHWMQLLHLNTRLAKLSEFINLQEIATVVIIYDHVMNSPKVIPQVCFRSEVW